MTPLISVNIESDCGIVQIYDSGDSFSISSSSLQAVIAMPAIITPTITMMSVSPSFKPFFMFFICLIYYARSQPDVYTTLSFPIFPLSVRT